MLPNLNACVFLLGVWEKKSVLTAAMVSSLDLA